MVALYQDWCRQCPDYLVEDGCAEAARMEDADRRWASGSSCGGDVFVTNRRFSSAASPKIGNAT
jgi:hypothetical protein